MKNLFTFIIYFGSFLGIAQQTDVVDFLKIEFAGGPNIAEKQIEGQYILAFKMLKDADSVYVDAVKANITEVVKKDLIISATDNKIWIIGNLKKNEIYSASFFYKIQPKQTLYFTGEQIWTQGQGKYTSHWLPSIDDVNDKIEFDINIITTNKNTVISNGNLTDIIPKNSDNYWRFNMEKPMSSYLVAFAIGNFEKKELRSDSGIPIELYYKPEDSLKAEPTYRYSKEIFDFLETEIGFAYPWQNYKQVPVRDFLYAGMENTTVTIFSEAFVVDSIGFNDKNYVNVNAHELAHQWFGNLVTETSSEHHWLQEGFATYYALLAEKEIFGEDYYYWKLYQSAEQLKQLSDEGKGESLMNPKASSLTFYEKGAWALHILRELIGDTAFKTAIKNYLEKHKFQNVSTEDFITEVKMVSKFEISEWEKNWLQQTAFQSEDAYKSLIKAQFMNDYFEISALRAVPFQDKKAKLENALSFPNDFIGQEAVYQLADEPISETLSIYKKGFNSNNLFVRQAIALSLATIPKELQTEYESLLQDNSYVTKEVALFNLWQQFPKKKKIYLDALEGVEGFQDKNIRQLWLALALVTENFRNDKKSSYLSELKNYSSADYSFEIREKSFQYLNELNLWDAETLKCLTEATTHPTWRFAKASKEILLSVLQNTNFKQILISAKSELSEKALQNLEKLI